MNNLKFHHWLIIQLLVGIASAALFELIFHTDYFQKTKTQ